jgi:hypothetical protein
MSDGHIGLILPGTLSLKFRKKCDVSIFKIPIDTIHICTTVKKIFTAKFLIDLGAIGLIISAKLHIHALINP